MKIGIMSDSHNEITNVIKARDFFLSLDIHILIHCGDITTSKVLDLLNDFKLFISYGNMDLDRNSLALKLKLLNDENRIGEALDIDLYDKRLFIIHGDNRKALDQAIQSDDFDYILTGHTHHILDERVGKTRVINPGALGGAFWEPRSIAILDLENDILERHYIK